MDELKDWLYRSGLLAVGLEIRKFSLIREMKLWFFQQRGDKRAIEVIWSYDSGRDVVYVSRRVRGLIHLVQYHG